jgi:hypothetical protein
MKKCQSYLQAGGKMPDMKDPKVRDQYVKFAQCMREHGVDMPDPGADGGLVFKTKPGSREKLDKARQACQSKLPGGGRGEAGSHDRGRRGGRGRRRHRGRAGGRR